MSTVRAMEARSRRYISDGDPVVICTPKAERRAASRDAARSYREAGNALRPAYEAEQRRLGRSLSWQETRDFLAACGKAASGE